MIRQARAYLAGAVSATAVVAAAVVAFVVLVSLQALQDWPLARLGGEAEEGAAVSEARPAAAPGPGPDTTSGTGATTPGKGAVAQGQQDSATAPPLGVEATAPIGDESPDAAGQPAADNGARPAATSSDGGGARASPGHGDGSPVASVGRTIDKAVSDVDGLLADPASGAAEVVDDVVTQTAGAQSTGGQATGQTGEVTGGLLGGDR